MNELLILTDSNELHELNELKESNKLSERTELTENVIRMQNDNTRQDYQDIATATLMPRSFCSCANCRCKLTSTGNFVRPEEQGSKLADAEDGQDPVCGDAREAQESATQFNRGTWSCHG